MLKGELRSIGLASLVQMLCAENRNVIVRVFRQGEDGAIYIWKRKVVHVTFGPLTGEDAFFKLAWWKKGGFRVYSLDSQPPTSVNLTTDHLLIEAMRRMDEERRELTDGDARRDQDLSAEARAHDQALLDELIQTISAADRWVERLRANRRNPDKTLDPLSKIVGSLAAVASRIAGDDIPPLEQVVETVAHDHPGLASAHIKGDRLTLKPPSRGRATTDTMPSSSDAASGLVALVQYYCVSFARLFQSFVSAEEWDDIHSVFVLDLEQQVGNRDS
ncbi:MAG: DUF4388 domain-containing protein [Acidobacteriota bacterium]